MKFLTIIVIFLLANNYWSKVVPKNNYIFMEYVPRDPNKPVTSVMFYTDTFNLKVFFCARYRVTTQEFNQIKFAIDRFPLIEKADTSVFSYYNITIFENRKMSRYFTNTRMATLKLFSAITDTLSNVIIKMDLKETLQSIEDRLE